ncbi:CoA transferase [Glutamicibacter sp.]|uniref:CoA transferase n=1 Tax=Glutamicibacter sp. TaxID=1931995 RepID=UPI0028BF3669|nr:CoA transferase [Glutamicibacter sp.]
MTKLVAQENTGEHDAVLASGFIEAALIDPRVGEQPGFPRWWGGPLDVESLAMGSVDMVVRVLKQLDADRRFGSVGPAQIGAVFDDLKKLRIDGRRAATFAPLSGFFATRDGWLRTHANYRHHERALLSALEISRSEHLTDALRQLDAEEAQERIVAAGGVAAAVRTRRQWECSAPALQGLRGHWAHFSLQDLEGNPRWLYDPAADAPLAGLRVLDLTRVIAGPTATRTLALFGAHVMRLDPPQYPEILDQYLATGFGKYSVQLDLAQRHELSVFHDLLAQADVLIAGYRGQSLDAFGLSDTDLRERHPNLIVAKLSAWGSMGPWATRRGFDSIVQAATGISEIYRGAAATPGALPVQALDHATGYGIAAAVIALLHAQRHLGSTGRVEFSLARTAQALYRFGAPQGAARGQLADPLMGRRESANGVLDYVMPPFLDRESPADYPFAPRAYAADAPNWG